MVGISLLVVLMVQDASCQYYRYPASTFPLHQFSYQAPLHFYPGLVPASAYQSNLVRHQTPFRVLTPHLTTGYKDFSV